MGKQKRREEIEEGFEEGCSTLLAYRGRHRFRW
jgi:hypothetical protein